MTLTKKERETMRKTLHGAATLTLDKNSALQLFDDLDAKDKRVTELEADLDAFDKALNDG